MVEKFKSNSNHFYDSIDFNLFVELDSNIKEEFNTNEDFDREIFEATSKFIEDYDTYSKFRTIFLAKYAPE